MNTPELMVHTVPLGTLIKRCGCGIEICWLGEAGWRFAVAYRRWNAEDGTPTAEIEHAFHDCEYSRAALVPKPVAPLRKTCAQCDAPIQWTGIEGGFRRPVDFDGRPHFQTCAFYEEAGRRQAEIRAAALPWNGENESPAAQRESRKNQGAAPPRVLQTT